jgi:hypothetical protein
MISRELIVCKRPKSLYSRTRFFGLLKFGLEVGIGIKKIQNSTENFKTGIDFVLPSNRCCKYLL